MTDSDGPGQNANAEAQGRSATGPSRVHRLLIAAGIGLFAACVSWLVTHRPAFGAPPDFYWSWLSARELVHGRNPFSTGIVYPLPAFLVAAPFTLLRYDVATALFSALSSALLAWVVTRQSYDRLPLFLSAAFGHGAVQGQWSMLLTAGLLAPSLSAVGAIKPNIGLCILAYRPTWRTALAMLAFASLGLLVMPDWPKQWLANFSAPITSGTIIHFAPIRSPGGFLILLALWRWRRPEARLLAAMALVPQSPFVYEVLPLFAVARTRFESYALVIGTDVALAYYALGPKKDMATFFHNSGIAVFVCVYLVALVLVLRRPNEGPLPAWLESASRVLPGWLRGRPAPAAQ
jgi:hypothetical protein